MLSFDEKSLCQRLGIEAGDPLIVELITVFLSDATALSHAIGLAMDQKDALAAKKAFHALKGAAANVDALALSTLASQGQESAAGGDLKNASRLFSEIQAEMKIFKERVARKGSAVSHG